MVFDGAEDLLSVEPIGGWHPAVAGRLRPRAAPRGALFYVVSLAMRWLGRQEVPEIFLVLLSVPRILVPWSWFASRLMPYGQLEALDRERMILRIAWNCRCRYEWVQHIEIGLRVGLSEADIARVCLGPEAEPDETRRAMLAACDELHASKSLSEQTYRALAGALGEERLIELFFLVGHFEGLASLLNSSAIAPEPSVLASIARLREASARRFSFTADSSR